MKEKVCCILDSDENYAARLTDYINERRALPYQAMAFTSANALKGCYDKYDIKLLVAGGDECDELNGIVKPEVYIRFVEDSDDMDENEIFRYQPADHIVKDIISHISGFSQKYSGNQTARILSVYSPATKCFKTTLALGIAVAALNEGKALFISFEQFAGLGNLLPSVRGGLSDALYYYKVGKEGASGKILSCTDRTIGFDFLAPAICADDIAELNDSEIVDFVYLLAKHGNYANIVIDVGCIFNRPWKLLEVSDKVIMPEPLDYMGRRKAAEFNNYLMLSGRSDIAGNIFKIDVPYDETLAGYEITAASVQNPGILQSAGRCLNG